MKILSRSCFYFILFLGFILIFLSLFSGKTLLSPNYCRMTYMNPYYAEMPVNSKYSYKYNLLIYKEGASTMSEFMKNPWPKGIPVLFIPGNAGHYKQGRSLASVSAQLSNSIKEQLQLDYIPEFDFYNVDLKEELSALSGEILIQQTQYINDCIKAILDVYKYLPLEKSRNNMNNETNNENNENILPSRPTSVLLIGHSMGGIIASSVFTQDNYIPNSVNTIITLNAPHNGHPFFYRESIALYYHKIHDYWKNNIHSTLKDVSIISISGSFRDQLIDSALTGLHGLIPTSNSFSVLTTSVPSVWVQTDHQCIVWCNQLVIKVSNMLLDLVDPNTFQNTLTLEQRMLIFQKHLLSNIPYSLGLFQESDIQFLPKEFITQSINLYHNPPKINSSSHIDQLPFKINKEKAIFYSNISQSLLPLTYIHNTKQSNSILQFVIPSSVITNNIHFIFLCDLPNEYINIYLCNDYCTHSLTDTSIGLPSHSSFKQYSRENRYYIPDTSDLSPQTLFHLSPQQLKDFNIIIIDFIIPNTKSKVLLAQFYNENDSIYQIDNEAFNYQFSFNNPHSALLNISIPLYDKFGSYLAILEPICKNPAFPPVIIQYRPALHEQHIHTNASMIPLRFHVSSDNIHKLLIISDSNCEYTLQIKFDLPLTLAVFAYSNRAAFVSSNPAWWCFIFGIYQFIYYKKKKLPGYFDAAVPGLFLCILILLLSYILPNSIFKSFFESLPYPFNIHSFYYFEAPLNPIALQLLLFSACCCVITLNLIVNLLLYIFKLFIRFFQVITKSSEISSNPKKSIILAILAFLLGYKTHIIISLVFSLIQIAVIHSKLSIKYNNNNILNMQKMILFYVILAIIDAIPSTINFCKIFLYERELDNSVTIGHLLITILTLIACYCKPHPSIINCISSFIVSLLIISYGLLPYYKISWFLTSLAIFCIISYFPLKSLSSELKIKND